MTTEQISEKLSHVPQYLVPEIMDYIDFLLAKHKRKQKKFSFDWEGGFEEFKDEFTSLELQKRNR